ncbi:MAG: dihydroorotase [Kiritimatiellae bacterium]|nr:dihydroorotase [Kiritimatiellia bacterium]
MLESLTLPLADDFHLHVRQGAMLRDVVPLIRQGGVGRCLVMPNTVPPITSVEQALAYRDEIQSVDPDLDVLTTLYLCPELTRDVIMRAGDAGITGVKLYPRGVTTHSDLGVADVGAYDEVFAAMSEAGLVLEIHGEVQSDADRDICVMNAEPLFLPVVERLHRHFPALRIVLEHVTTAEAVAFVERAGERIAATITVHHLDLIVDDWAGQNHNFCKPVAKYPHDRAALRAAVSSGSPKFFLGSDSAPHPRDAKECAVGCAGVFTSPLMLPYLADCFERIGCLEKLAAFVSENGRRFYDVLESRDCVTLERRPCDVPKAYGSVVPYRAGETLAWSMV